MRISDWSSDVCSSDLREHSGIEIEAVAVRLGVEDEGEPVVPVAQFCRKLDQRPSRANVGLANDDAASRLARDPGAKPQAVDLELRHANVEAGKDRPVLVLARRSEEHTSELQSLIRISYAVFCLKNKNRQRKDKETQK